MSDAIRKAVEEWKLVPVEPTGEQWAEARSRISSDIQRVRGESYEMAAAIADKIPAEVYRAMLAASPVPPAAQPGELDPGALEKAAQAAAKFKGSDWERIGKLSRRDYIRQVTAAIRAYEAHKAAAGVNND